MMPNDMVITEIISANLDLSKIQGYLAHKKHPPP